MNKRVLAAVVMTAAVSVAPWAWGAATTRPAFTIGEETTVVKGPLHADGTIHYVAALNELLGKGVTPETNAAIPLLQAYATPEMLETLRPVLEELKVPAIEGGSPLRPFALFIRDTGTRVYTDEELEAMEGQAQARPWTGKEFPELAEWLKESRAGLLLVKEASRRPRYFVPFVSKRTPATADDALPSVVPLYSAGKVLVIRAMERAGARDLDGALADLACIRALARHAEQGKLILPYLVGIALDSMAIRAYQNLLANGGFAAGERQRIAAAAGAAPALAPLGESHVYAERLYVLDIVMCMVRGDGERVWRVAVSPIDPPEHLDLGDLPRADWDAMMKEMGRIQSAAVRAPDVPFMDHLRRVQRAAEEAKREMVPQSGFLGDDLGLQGRKAYEAYFKQRAGESREQFSQRIGRFLVSESGPWEGNFLKILHGYRLQAALVPVAAALEDYKEARGRYPETLAELKVNIPRDEIAGAPPRYRVRDGGYTVWIVGVNERDDEGKEDDMPMGNAK